MLLVVEEIHNKLPLGPNAVGGLALGILLMLLVGLLMFGKGREHN